MSHRFKGVLRFLLPVVLFLSWEAAARLHWLDGRLFPAPTSIWGALASMARTGALWSDAGASVLRVAVGFALASAAAVPLAAVFARWRIFSLLGMPVIEILRPISVIAWIPIAILWFGLGNRPTWFIIFIGAFFPIFTNAFAGFRSVDPALVDAADCLGAGRLLFVREILWPSALPHILIGLRVGAGTAWTAVIAAELISGQSGLGYMIQMARMMLETEKVFAGMVLIGVIGCGMNALILLLEEHLVPWREDHAQ